MLQARPLTGATTQHVHRLRLLNLLPDTPGHVVWFHAPLGYGKSILAAQWAEALEIDGWRILWTATGGRTIQAVVAGALRLPAGAPWPVIQDELAMERTLLVIEDLEGPEELEQLLRYRHNSLLLLASRGQLTEPELGRLRTQGQLIEVTAAELAFTLEEAEQLAQRLDSGTAESPWQDTGGWPLPLHLALLTGSTTSLPLHEALRRSVTAAAWQETLFLASAGDLLHSAGTDATHELVKAGVLQQLSRHYRMHPMIAAPLLSQLKPLVHTALEASAERLTPAEQLFAAERADHQQLLRTLLTHLPIRTVSEYATDFQRMVRHFTEVPDAGLRVRTALAELTLRPEQPALSRLEAVLADDSLAEDDRFLTISFTMVILARQGQAEQAAEWIERGRKLLPGQSLRNELLFLGNSVPAHGWSGRIDEAVAAGTEVVERAAGSTDRQLRQLAVLAELNMSLFRFEQTGDVRTQLAKYQELEHDPHLDPSRLPQVKLNLAIFYLYDNQVQRALHSVLEYQEYADPYNRLWAEVIAAYIRNDVEAFQQLLPRSSNWAIRSMAERVAALWLRVCRKSGDLATPSRIDPLLPDAPFVNLERAVHRHLTGDQAEAERLLERSRNGHPDREFHWHWQAASFLINDDPAELERLLALAVEPAPLLRYTLIPLKRLPRGQPELADGYPLDEVLDSGWSEAIARRLHELPPLTVRLLGGFSVQVLGHTVQLPARQQQLLALIALGYSRERIAEQLWPDSDMNRTANNLSVQLHSLRRALEPWGVPTYFRDGSLTHTDLDVLRLRSALAEGDATAVLKLYRGELLPEMDVPVISAERDELAERVVVLFAQVAETAAPATALQLLERLLQLDPLHEQAMHLLVQKLLQLGRRNAARQRFQQFQQRLQRETGLQPRAELLALLAD